MSYWFLGVNPVVDLILVRTHPEHGLQTLLIKRSETCDAEAGKWAFPGGFRDTDALKGTAFNSGKFQELPLVAALRECKEETGISTDKLASYVREVGVYTGPGRDPRETNEQYSQSHAYFLSLDGLMSISQSDLIMAQAGEVDVVRWFNWKDAMQTSLAFDHNKICTDAQRYLSDKWVVEAKAKSSLKF